MQDLKDAAFAIIGSREFCGDETQSLRDWQADNRILSAEERHTVCAMANQIWARYQRQAGVTAPIDHLERAQITRILNKS